MPLPQDNGFGLEALRIKDLSTGTGNLFSDISAYLSVGNGRDLHFSSSSYSTPASNTVENDEPPLDTVSTYLAPELILPNGRQNIVQSSAVADEENNTQLNLEVDTEGLDPTPSSDIQEIVQRVASYPTSGVSSEEIFWRNALNLNPYTAGVFTVGETGVVRIDYLFDGGGYGGGQVAIVNLDGMEALVPGSSAFNKEAAYRALSNSELGYVVISDEAEGARFSGILGNSDKDNFNQGTYRGPQTFKMAPGSLFAIMIVPDGKVQEVFDNPGSDGSKRPLYSLSVANPDDTIHIGQLLDVFGDGTTFGMEDLRTDTGSDMDGNDFIFKIEGAKGYAPLLSDFVNPTNDWRYSKLGQEIFAYVSTNDNPNKVVPGDPVRDPILPVPQIPFTLVDQGGNSLAASTLIAASSTQDVIDQVSNADPTDIYRVAANSFSSTQFTVLSGLTTVSFLSSTGQVLGSQIFGKGTHTLALPGGLTGDVFLKIDNRDNSTATYVLQGFESQAAEPFNIDIDFGDGVTASQQSVIRAAAKSVEAMIKQGLPSAIVDGRAIDDITIKVNLADLDGAGGTLAQTRLEYLRYGTLLPALSQVQLDGRDITNLESSGRLFSVAQHELLHALGFGNLWEAKGLIDYAKTPFSRYTGKNAVAAFQTLGGVTSFIPLETNGDGSADLHWNENLFQYEVMTKDLNAGGVIAPVSPITLASLMDLGYEVNLNSATPNWNLLPQVSKDIDSVFTDEEKAQLALLIAEAEAQPPSDIPTIVPPVDVDTIAPTIWAHAERFDRNGEYYDWDRVIIRSGDTISQYVFDRMANHSSSDNRSRVVKANDPAYWAFISARNGFPDPNWIVAGDPAWLPMWHPNYAQEQEAERKRREEELRQKEEEERKQREKLEEAYRQNGQGGLEWYLSKPLPDFTSSAPYETSIRDLVGSLVPDDYFRFTLSRNGRVTLYLEDLLADADLYLYDSRNRLVGQSTRSGLTDEKLVLDLAAGTYLVRVHSPGGVTTDYDLKMFFQGQLTRSQMGPPAGWAPGGGTSGSGRPRPTFADPRIERVFTTARDKFANEQWARVQPEINSLEDQKRQKQQELDRLLAEAIAQQKAKVNTALDGVRNDLQGRISSGASNIKNSINGVANGAINIVNGLIPDLVWKGLNLLGLDGSARKGLNDLRDAINGARNWLNSQVDWVRDQINGAISQFIEMVKNAYVTGAEINAAIQGASDWLKSRTDGLVNFLNDKIGEFKGRILGGLEWTKTIRVGGWNLYDHAVVGMVDGVANNARNAVSGAGGAFKAVLDVATPLAQGAVAYIVDALIGDKTGNLYNEIYGVNQRIENIKSGVKKAISDQTAFYKQLLEQFLGGLGQAKDFVVGAIFGGFNNDASLWQILFDAALPTVVGIGVDILTLGTGGRATEIALSVTQGVRDLVAELFKVVPKVQKGEQLTAGDWLGLGAAAVGAALSAVPLAGPYLRSLARIAGMGRKGAGMLTELKKLGGPIVETVVNALKNSVNWDDIGKKAGDLLEMVLDKGRELLIALGYAMQVFDKNVLGRMNLSYEAVGASGLAYQSLVTKSAGTLSSLSRQARPKVTDAASEIKNVLDNAADNVVDEVAERLAKDLGEDLFKKLVDELSLPGVKLLEQKLGGSQGIKILNQKFESVGMTIKSSATSFKQLPVGTPALPSNLYGYSNATMSHFLDEHTFEFLDFTKVRPDGGPQSMWAPGTDVAQMLEEALSLAPYPTVPPRNPIQKTLSNGITVQIGSRSRGTGSEIGQFFPVSGPGVVSLKKDETDAILALKNLLKI